MDPPWSLFLGIRGKRVLDALLVILGGTRSEYFAAKSRDRTIGNG
jgi:hypothetical protein